MDAEGFVTCNALGSFVIANWPANHAMSLSGDGGPGRIRTDDNTVMSGAF
jgi:hypothetical protein